MGCRSRLGLLAKRRTMPFAIATVLTMLASVAGAQTTGRLVGVVEDAQGAVLPGVTVTATSPQLQGASTSVTDANGQYRFPALPPGVYGVKAELSGFKTFEQKDVRVQVDQTISLNLKLQVAGLVETVNVLGSAPVIDTTSGVGGISVGQAAIAAHHAG